MADAGRLLHTNDCTALLAAFQPATRGEFAQWWAGPVLLRRLGCSWKVRGYQ
jgi:hypothetical protein